MASIQPKLSPAIQTYIDKGLFDRLPVSFSAFCFDQMKDWDLLFPNERRYFERLFDLLDRSGQPEVDRLFEPMRAAETQLGVNEKTWPKRQFTLDQVDFLNRNPHYPEWRAAVSTVFGKIDPLLDAEIARKGKPRLVVVISPADIPTGPDRMWLRIANRGKRVAIQQPENVEDFVPLLLTGLAHSQSAPSLAETYAGGSAPYDAWVVEAGDRLAGTAGKAVHCSYTRLDTYRKRLMTEVNRMVGSAEIRGPRQLSEHLKHMKVTASEADIARDAIMAEFTRATLLSGNGTLLINNTFVEWATVQAIRRARPSVTVVGFGVRNKVKPFSSLLIYADQAESNPIPTQTDTLGTYVDLEVFYQYILQEFEKYAEYRRNTVYLFVGEGMDELLAIGPADFPLLQASASLTLPTVHADCAKWLGLA